MTDKWFTMGDAQLQGQQLVFDFYLSEDSPPPGTPPKKLLSHKKALINFRDSRDAQKFYDILVLGIGAFQISDNKT